MDLYLLALQLMAFQALLGAFDTLYHHELTEALPQRSTARKELMIHSIRSSLYCVMFLGLAAWQWHGVWALVLVGIFVVEIVLTLWDFVVEDKTRLLPPTERVTHTVLAINGGAFLILLILNVPDWYAQPTAFYWSPNGWLSAFLFICGIGVGFSGLRDGLASYQINKINHQKDELEGLQFNHSSDHVLVTGATGFVGQCLLKALLADGHKVTVLTRSPKAAAWLFSGRVCCIADMQDLPTDSKIDVIVNLAGARILGWHWTKKRKQVLRNSRVVLTQKLVDWIATVEYKPRLLLSASAIGYYGIQQEGDQEVLHEDSATQPIFMSQLCQEWEASAQQASQYGVKVAIMRFAFVLGHQGSLPMMLLPIKLGMGGPLGSGKQWLSWVHVDDLVRAMAHLWQNTEEGERGNKGGFQAYNISAPEAVSQKEFSQTAAELMGRPSFITTPAFIMRALLGEQADLLVEGQRVAPLQLQEEGFKFKYTTVKEALSSLQ